MYPSPGAAFPLSETCSAPEKRIGETRSFRRVNYLFTSHFRFQRRLVLLFPSLLTIPLARQCLFNSTLFAWFQVKGVTLYFLNNVLRLHLALEAAQSILKRLAFLHANLCQRNTPPTWPSTGIL